MSSNNIMCVSLNISICLKMKTINTKIFIFIYVDTNEKGNEMTSYVSAYLLIAIIMSWVLLKLLKCWRNWYDSK
jgi:hypothetical protein